MNRIEFERRKRHWSQAVLAMKCRVSQPVIALAEAGDASEDVLERLSHAFGLTPVDILLREVRPALEPEELATEARL